MKDKEPIYVIGFPKSGNTWLARLLADVTNSKISVSNSKDLVNSADNSSDRAGDYLIYKKHTVANIDDVQQSKKVYIVRDIRDVLPSWFFHCNRWATSNIWLKKTKLFQWYYNTEILKSNKMLRGSLWGELCVGFYEFLRFFIRGKSQRVPIGNWSDHVSYWKKQPGVIFVKYEDLILDTEKEIKKILDFLNIKASDEMIKSSIFNQSFDQKKLKFNKNGDYKNAKFLRSGKAGGWQKVLVPAVVKEIEHEHKDVMSKLGYKIGQNKVTSRATP